MDKVHVIVNPVSAKGNTGRRWLQIKEALSASFKEFRYIFTEKPKQATDISRELLREGYDLIIGVGGDGTLNEIASGFFEPLSAKAVNKNACLGMIPSGTGSDLVRFLKIPRDLFKSVEWLKNSPKKKMDIGRITFTGSGNGSDQRFFVNVADFGLGAEVVRRISSVAPERRGSMFYYRGFISTLFKYRSKHCKLTIDETETIDGSFLIGAVANGGIFGGGMIVAPRAEVTDGYFDLVLIEDMSKMEVIRSSSRLYTGTIDSHSKVHTIRAKKVNVSSSDTVFVEYDGEAGGLLPAEFDVIEQAINLRFR